MGVGQNFIYLFLTLFECLGATYLILYRKRSKKPVPGGVVSPATTGRLIPEGSLAEQAKV